MKTSCMIAVVMIGIGATAALGEYEVVDSPGYFMQWEGSFTPCDINPIAGGWRIPEQPVTDEDPEYDWLILESMVSVPLHESPFYLWPGSEHINEGQYTYTHGMGFSMGMLLVWRDTNGDDPSDWAQGEMLLSGELGMNHQHSGEHSAMSYWIDGSGEGPYPFEFLGTITATYGGTWKDTQGSGYVIKGTGQTTWYEQSFDNHQTGNLIRFQIEPMRMHLGDMNLDGEMDYRDVAPFLDQIFGDDHDESRHMLADMDEDGVITVTDLIMFLNLLPNAGDVKNNSNET